MSGAKVADGLPSVPDPSRQSARLLWSACHWRPRAESVKAAIDAGSDIPLAVSAALRHRVAGLLWRALEEADALDTLGDLRQALSELAEIQRMRDQLLVPQALQLSLTPLLSYGLEPVVLRGPAVSRFYPDQGLRPFDDIDILLPRDAHARAVTVLRDGGWELRRTPARDRYDSVLVHPGLPEIPLELHYGLDAWYERASSLRADDLWRVRLPLELAGVPAFALPLPEQLVMLCAHAAKPYHGFSRLIWIADLAMVLGDTADRREEMDWYRVQALARQAQCSTAVSVALALARFAGAAIPPGVVTLPDAGWRAVALDRLVDESWPLAVDAPIHLRFALAEGKARRLLLLLGYTHGMPGFKAASWYLHNLAQALWRWRDLTARPPGQ